jgi:hypothetical protein
VQTADTLQKPDYPLDKVYDVINPNRKIWDALGHCDYTPYCRKWSKPKSSCERWNREAGRDVREPSDYLTIEYCPVKKIPKGYRCDDVFMFPDLQGPSAAPGANYDDAIDLARRIFRNVRGGDERVFIYRVISIFELELREGWCGLRGP